MMTLFAAILIVIMAVVLDFFWFDVDQKRWGWMKNWSMFHRILFFSGFILVSFVIYIGIGLS